MQCAVRRWGPGTTKERPVDTEASRELQNRLNQMKAERTQQDKMWDETTSTEIVAMQTATAATALQLENFQAIAAPKKKPGRGF